MNINLENGNYFVSELLYTAAVNNKNITIEIDDYQFILHRLENIKGYEVKLMYDGMPLNPVFSLRYIEEECITQDFFDRVIRLIYDSVPRVREYFKTIMLKDGNTNELS